MAKKTEPKPSPKKDERTQQQRFEEFAREHGATEDALDKALGEIAAAKSSKQAG